MRCFVALPVPEDVRERLVRLQAALRMACGRADVRWNDASTWHLTLEFLGDRVEPGQLVRISEVVGACARRAALPVLSLAGIGAFPEPRHARVLWIGLAEGAREVTDLAGAIEEGLVPLGFGKDPKAFRPHLTLGRLRSPARGADLREALAAVEEPEGIRWKPGAVVLYESHLRPGGAVHEARGAWPIA